jgi:hypothetical protein
MKFIKDIFTESKEDNKYSSKKTMGIISGVLGFIAFLVDGFKFYEISDTKFDSLLLFSATMLGASILGKFASKG